MRKITESQLRKIIRQEIKNVTDNSDNSLFADGVTPEMMIEYITKFCDVTKLGGGKTTLPDPQKTIQNLTLHGAYTQEEAEQLVDIVKSCLDVREQTSQNNVYDILDTIAAKFKVPKHKLQNYYDYTNLKDYVPSWLFTTVLWYADGSEKALHSKVPVDNSIKKITKEVIEQSIEFMNIIKALAEDKPVPKGTLGKIRTLINKDYNGLVQASELYSML